MDNAGTFDTLIPLLPKYIGYLAIDLPGHGLSPFQPAGTVYSHMQYIYILNYVFREHFRWPRVSIIGHSMSAILLFLYAAAFPDYVDMAVALDVLKPRHYSEGLTRAILCQVNGNWLRTDLNNMNADSEPPTYSYEELIDRMVAATGESVDRVSAPYLLQRGTRVSRSDPERFYFSRDNKLKVLHMVMLTAEATQTMAERIRCPYMLLKALESPYSEDRAAFQQCLQWMQASNPLFELHGVDGLHHIHLTDPEKVAVKVGPFIRKYRPETEVEKDAKTRRGEGNLLVAKL